MGLPRAGGFHITEVGVEPIEAGASRDPAGENLDGVAVLELRIEGYEAAVDLSAQASVAQLGMNAVGGNLWE